MLALLSVYSEGLATKKQVSNQSLASTNRPFWFDLQELFYEKLQKAAIEFQTTRAALVTEAIGSKTAEPSKTKKKAATPTALTEAAKEKLVREYLSRARLLGWEESRALARRSPEQQKKGTHEDFRRIFWLDLPSSFFQDVKNKAKQHGLSEKGFVQTAVETFIRDERKARKLVHPISDVQEQLVKEFYRTAGAMRWEGENAKSRKEHARKMALKRWGKKNSDPKEK